MPDDKNQSIIQERLAALGDTFNPNKGFGLMGVLNAQEEAAQAAGQGQQPAVQQQADEAPKWVDAVISSNRATKEETKQLVDSLRNDITSLRSPVAVQPHVEFDPADPTAARFSQLEAGLNTTRLRTEWQRALNSFQSAKQRHGEGFAVTEADLKRDWDGHIRNNPDNAELSNWDHYFDSLHYERERPKLLSRLQDLEAKQAQGAGARDVVNDMSALPRGNRIGAPTPAAGNVGEFDEDVYQAASKQMGKWQFRGFNNALVQAQNKKLLRTG